jgi:IclR family KDG regulon transcriptional repressor
MATTDKVRKSGGKTQANQSVAKALKILDYFRLHPEGRLSDLAEHAGLGPSTALRLILSLEHYGALVRDRETREYAIGPWLLGVAATTVRSHPFIAEVHRTLTELCETTGETASYWVVTNRERVCVDRVLSRHALSSTIHIGARVPLHIGAAGRALVAFLPDEERQLVLDALDSDDIDIDALIDSLDKIRDRGYAISVEEREKGLASVAVPIPDQKGGLVGAISATGPVSRFNAAQRRDVVDDLMVAASRLSNYRVLER